MADDPPLRVLILEDSPEDAELAQRALRDAGLVITSHVVASEQAFRAALAEFVPQLILTDLVHVTPFLWPNATPSSRGDQR